MVGTSRCDVRTAKRAVPTSGNEITPEKDIEVVASCITKMSNEKSYLAGHCLAGPPSSAAHALSSCSKN
jgi:hypothetical protein